MNNRFSVVGLRRTGNHAIISWLSYHFNENRVLFMNDLDPTKPIFSDDNLLKHNKKRHKLEGHSPFITDEIKKEYNDYDLLLYSHEERKLKEINNEDPVILIMRDPYNIIASRIKTLETNPKPYFNVDKKFQTILKQYLREFDGQTNILKNKSFINFNKWYYNIEYRKTISKRFGWKFNDTGHEVILPHGGGSSFDNSKRMDVLNRWKEYYNHPLFKLIVDDEINSLSLRIFGEII